MSPGSQSPICVHTLIIKLQPFINLKCKKMEGEGCLCDMNLLCLNRLLAFWKDNEVTGLLKITW